MPEAHIVVVGSTNTDLFVRSDRLPLPGETVLGGDLVIAPGGKGANQAVAAARAGARVVFITRLGKDIFGDQAYANLQREGLEVSYISRDTDRPSGVALIVVGPGGQNMIAVAPGANSALTPEAVCAASQAFTGARLVLLQLEVPLETVMAAAQMGKSAGAQVILNPAPAQPLPDALYPFLDIMTPNETEAALLTGKTSPQEAAEALLQRGLRTVIVTLGEAGVLICQQHTLCQRRLAFCVPAVDTVAAGDAFTGSLAAALGRGLAIEAAVRYAQAGAALSVTRQGAQPSLPTDQEVSAFLLQHP